MSAPTGFADKVSFVWGVADLLRGDFKAHEYGQVILPLVVLRRLECALAATKDKVVAKADELGESPGRDAVLRSVARHKFWNATPLDLTRILADPGTAAPNLGTYLAGFSPSAREVLDAYGFEDKIARLERAGLLYQVLARFADLDLSEQAVSNEAMGYVFEELLRRFSEMSNPRYIVHYLSTDAHLSPTDMLARGATMQRLSRSQVGALKLPVPDRDAQQRVIRRLDQAVQSTDEVAAAITLSAVLLEERKRALITACVTGEFDVSTASDRAAEAALAGVPTDG